MTPTVWIYVDANKQVGETPTTSRSLRMPAPRQNGLRKTIPKAWPLSMRFWNERRPQTETA